MIRTMANVQKYTRAQVGGLTRHFERAKKDTGEYYQFGNQEVDIARSHLNYNLAPDRDQLSFIRQRTSEVECVGRANINVMCSWVITSPKGMSDDELPTFFEEAYGFLNRRYANGGEQNVVSAFVHMDEVSPHLHYAFIPVVHDVKKGIDKVSAKAVVDRKDLQTFHKDLERHMSEVFGREIGILNEATKAGNKTIQELKNETVKAEHEKLQTQLTDMRTEEFALRLQADGLRDEVETLEKKKKQLEVSTKAMQKLKDLSVPVGEVNIKNKSKALPGGYFVWSKDLEKLEEQAKAYAANRGEILRLREKEKSLKSREQTVSKKESKANALYKQQSEINQVLEQTGLERNKFKARADAAGDENIKLRQEVGSLKKEIGVITERLHGAYQSVMNVVKAIGMLKYSTDESLKIEPLTPELDRFIDALRAYGIRWAEADGLHDMAEQMKKYVGISQGIAEEIKTLEQPPPQQKRNRGHDFSL